MLKSSLIKSQYLNVVPVQKCSQKARTVRSHIGRGCVTLLMPTLDLCVEMFNSLNLGGGLGVCMLVFMMGLCLEKFKMFKCSKFGVWVCVCVPTVGLCV